MVAYSDVEKEMLCTTFCLREHERILSEERFFVFINHIDNGFFLEPDSGGIRQTCVEFLLNFDFAWIRGTEVDPRLDDLARIQTLSTRTLSSMDGGGLSHP